MEKKLITFNANADAAIAAVDTARKALINLGTSITMAAEKAGLMKPIRLYPRISVPFTRTLLLTTGVMILITLLIAKL